MRNLFWVPLAALVGLVAGSWGPREDLKALERNAQAAESKKTASASAGFDAFANLAHIPSVAQTRRPETNALARVDRVADDAQAETNDVVEAAEAKRPHPFDRHELGARLEEAAELWNTRVELAKVQWKERLGVDDAETEAGFDAAFAAMNAALRETMEAMAEEIGRAGKMNTELGLRLMGDVSRTLSETYDALGEVLPADRREEVAEMPVFEFIDPMVAEPLVGVQDKLGDGVQFRPGRGRRGR